MTMGDTDARIIAELTDGLRTRLRSQQDATHFTIKPFSTSTGFNVIVKCTGRSPTLHRTRLFHSFEISDAGNLEGMLDKALEEMEPLFTEQRLRRGASEELGHREYVPLPVMEHLQTDVAFPVIARLRDRDPRTVLETMLRQAHCETTEYRVGAPGNASGVMIREAASDAGTCMRILLPHVKMTDKDFAGPKVAWRGHNIEIKGITLPESTIASLPGKRLGDVVSIHDLLDDRIIRKAVGSVAGRLDIGIDLTIESIPDILDA